MTEDMTTEAWEALFLARKVRQRVEDFLHNTSDKTDFEWDVLQASIRGALQELRKTPPSDAFYREQDNLVKTLAGVRYERHWSNREMPTSYKETPSEN